MITIAADDITVRGLTLVGFGPEGDPWASVGVKLESGVSGCVLAENTMRGFVGSGVVGDEVGHCTFVANRVSEVGGDGFRVRGRQLTVIRNVFERVFDESLDLTASQSAVVIENCARYSRIGIVLTSPHPTLFSNVVSSQVLEGIRVYSKGNGSIVDNRVSDGGKTGLTLSGVRFVYHNEVRDEQRTGLWAEEPSNAVVGGNGVERDIARMEFRPETAALLSNYEFTNTVPRSSPAVARCPPPQSGVAGLFGIQSSPEDPVDPAALTPDVKAPDEDAFSERVGARIQTLLRNYNPGFLSLEVHADRMESEITDGMAEALEYSPLDVIDAVRAPMHSYWRADHPTWILRHSGRPRFLVSRWPSGPGVRVSALDPQGQTSLWESLYLRFRRVSLP
jgi:hypothetical protein